MGVVMAAVQGAVIAISLVALSGASRFVVVNPIQVASHSTGRAPLVRPSTGSVTQVEMRNVDFVVDPDVVLHIHRLRGTMRSKTSGPILFDDKQSLIIHLASAEVGLTGNDITALLNKYVFAYSGAPLKRLRVTIAGTEIVQTGYLHKLIDLPFTIHATLSATPDGHIRIHPTRTQIAGLHADGIMRGTGLSLEKLVDLRKAHGASVKGNDIYLAPDSILPPPSIEGTVTGVRIEGDQIVETYRDSKVPASMPLPDAHASNFMFFRGGSLRFGKLLMLDAEMLVVDLDPADPFKFDLSHYQAQLISGYSKTLPDLGLEVYMHDADKVTRRKGH